MRVLLGMSGGVDSTVAAYLLKQQGHDVVGVTLCLNGTEDSTNAQKCAEALGIEFHAVNIQNEFSKLVKTPFAEGYMKGITPNPCVICNKHIKFGVMADLCENYNCDALSTGHYVKSEFSEKFNRFVLKKGVDSKKDQSYFLWSLTQNVLRNTIFPLADMTKPEIITIAQREVLPCVGSKESQDVCFIPDGDCLAFISDFTGIRPVPGDFVTEDGRILGQHRGICAYTVGQRKGLGISADAPLYVLKKDAEANTVTLGYSEKLFHKKVFIKDINLIAFDKLDNEITVDAKIRYSPNTAKAVLKIDGDRGSLTFETPQRAPSPGQSAVFYDGDILLGGGEICGYE